MDVCEQVALTMYQVGRCPDRFKRLDFHLGTFGLAREFTGRECAAAAAVHMASFMHEYGCYLFQVSSRI